MSRGFPWRSALMTSGRREIVPGLHEAELAYLHDEEWARSADDVLWRRSKLGLKLASIEKEALARFMAEQVVAA